MAIYPVPPVLNCNGTVSALDFCYSERNMSRFNTEAEAFKLLILNMNGTSFTVTNIIEVHSTARAGTCSIHRFTSITIQYCCDRFSLDPEDWFDVPSPNFAIGITTYPDTTRNLLAYISSRFTNLVAQSFEHVIEGEIPPVGSTITQEMSSNKALRMFSFVLGKCIGVDLLS